MLTPHTANIAAILLVINLVWGKIFNTVFRKMTVDKLDHFDSKYIGSFKSFKIEETIGLLL